MLDKQVLTTTLSLSELFQHMHSTFLIRLHRREISVLSGQLASRAHSQVATITNKAGSARLFTLRLFTRAV